MILSRRIFLFRGLLLSVSKIPFILPSIALIIGFASLFGLNGIIKGVPYYVLYSFIGIVAVHSYYNFPLVFNYSISSLSECDFTKYQCARILGANKILSFFCCVFPSISQSLLSSFLLTFIYSFSSFAIVHTFGGIHISNLEGEIYRVVFSDTSGEKISALSLLSLTISVVFFLIFYFCVKNTKSASIKKNRSLVRERGAYPLFSIIIIFLILLPLLSILKSAFIANNNFSLKNFYQSFKYFSIITKSISFSFFVSIVAVFIAFVLSADSIRREKLNFTILVPQLVSTILFSSGIRNIEYFPLFVSHLYLVVPLSYMMIYASYKSYPSLFIEEAKMLGASDIVSAFCIELNTIKETIVNSLVLSFALSLGDVSTTLVVSKGRFSTLSTLIYASISHYRFSNAAALCVIYALVVLLYFVVLKFIISCW